MCSLYQKFYIPIFLLLCALACFAHENKNMYGVKVGVNYSNLIVDDKDARPFFGHEIDWLIMSNLIAPQIGIFKTFPVTSVLHIQPELYYTRKGSDASTEFLFDSIDYKIKLDYIELPVLVKLCTPISQTITAGFYAGPYGAITIKAQRTSRIDGVRENLKLKNAERFDYGLVFGLSSNIIIADRIFILDFRYNHGLANIMNKLSGSTTVSDAAWVKNNAGLLLVGVQL